MRYINSLLTLTLTDLWECSKLVESLDGTEQLETDRRRDDE